MPEQEPSLESKADQLISQISEVLQETIDLRKRIDGLSPESKEYFNTHIIGNKQFIHGTYYERIDEWLKHSRQLLDMYRRGQCSGPENTQQLCTALEVLHNLADIAHYK